MTPSPDSLTEERLLPCPFCGGEAGTIDSGDKWYVTCIEAKCYCSLGEIWDADAMPDHHFRSEAEAIATWNRRALPAPSGEMREMLAGRMRANYIAKWKPNHKSWSEIDDGMREIWLFHADSAIAALRPSTSPQGDRNEQIKAMIVRFDEKVKTWTPQQALGYLVELGTHDADGNLTPEYGGSSPQGNEMWEVLGEDWSISRLLNELTDPYGDNQDDAAIMKKAAKVIEYMQRVSRISGPERIKAQ